MPHFTVIALCYNHEPYALECLESIRKQSCQEFELVVIDDCSQDDSPKLIAAWLSHHYPSSTFIRHTANGGLRGA